MKKIIVFCFLQLFNIRSLLPPQAAHLRATSIILTCAPVRRPPRDSRPAPNNRRRASPITRCAPPLTPHNCSKWCRQLHPLGRRRPSIEIASNEAKPISVQNRNYMVSLVVKYYCELVWKEGQLVGGK